MARHTSYLRAGTPIELIRYLLMRMLRKLKTRGFCYDLIGIAGLMAGVGCAIEKVEVQEPEAALFCHGPGDEQLDGGAFNDCVAERRIAEPFEDLKS